MTDIVFQSRIEYVEEDVLDAVNHFSRAIKISANDRDIYKSWRQELKSQFEGFLSEHGGSDSAVFAVECELEYRARMAITNPVSSSPYLSINWIGSARKLTSKILL